MYIRHDKTDCSKAKNNQDSIITEQKYCCNILQQFAYYSIMIITKKNNHIGVF